MIETFKVVISALGGAFITGLFGVWLQQLKNKNNSEGIYADHIEELFERLDKTTEERDGLKGQVSDLTFQLIEQKKVVDSLTRQMGDLKNKLNEIEVGK
ncbi:hypothetical protein [Companilactobacillus nodensis]|uniref:hypothetical protein n=1 Tax=Companilactobacillus nodensis TaxID=460870 RepID=UPI000469DF6D|nr:hypothetical protein [Companilactobacillus nodensis]